MCTLTIPTTCTIDTMTKVVGKIKQWHDCRANNGPIFISNIRLINLKPDISVLAGRC
jgi:hypothetical protein